MNLLFCDIETSKVPEPEPWVVDGMKPPGTMSKPETIAKWREEQAPEVARDQSSLTALYGGFVVCVGVAVDERPVQVLAVDEVTEAGERALLEKLDAGLARYPGHVLCGWRIAEFDARFLRQRAARHGIWRLAGRLWQAKPWDARILDLHLAWQAGDKRQVGRLKQVARYLGIPVADEVDGSGVQDLLDRGDLASVVEHCRSDVEITRQLAWRFQAAGWLEGLDPDAAPDLPVRPPRPSPLQEAQALARAADRKLVFQACRAAGIEWDGGIEGEAGPVLVAASVQQVRRFVLEVLRQRGEAA